MNALPGPDAHAFIETLKQRTPHEHEFHQAVAEVVTSVMPTVLGSDAYQRAAILERLTEPDRLISFRVTWEDDERRFRVNRGYRVQWTNAIGPYKGGLRFHPSVTPSVLKFLAFEQTFKNSLTGLPMGGAKGGSDFDPKGKSDAEIMRFCQAFMNELQRHIGEDIDVPAGDIGVGAREIGFLFGHYTHLRQRWAGVMTGKSRSYGGSEIRTEATGYGCVWFCKLMLEYIGKQIEDQPVAISGSGNVALYAAERAMQLGAKVLTLSDSAGFVFARNGISAEQLAWIRDLKENRRGRIAAAAAEFKDLEFHEGRPWSVPCRVALPCATQNELDEGDARQLVEHGVWAVCEGANMPTTPGAVDAFHDAGVALAPGKAANAGGVAVSGLEQSQNASRQSWPREVVQQNLEQIMADIHAKCVEHGQVGGGGVNYVHGANIGGFRKVADALVAYGAH